MLYEEWDIDKFGAMQREEGIEIGREEGWEKGQEAERLNIARNALAKGLSMEMIQDITGLDRETIERLSN